MKKALNILKTILVWLVVAVAVAMMVFTIVSVTTVDRNDRNLFGLRFYIVMSDSMSATGIDAGDIVVVKETDPAALQPGDIIAYTSRQTENYGQTITHMIRQRTTDENGSPAFITYGTTTNTDDELPVTYPYVLGRYTLRLPKVGLFFQFLKTTPGYIVCILLPFLLLIGYQGLNCVKVFRLYKKEQMDELQAEKDSIAAERKKTEDMMAELMALKAQLEGQQKQPGENAEQPAEPAEQPAVLLRCSGSGWRRCPARMF